MADLRTIKTYRSLTNAFLELLEKQRFEEITVRQLCESAQIRRATFYTHFADKYEFLAFFIQEMRNEFMERITTMNDSVSDQTDTYYELLFHELLMFFKERPQLVCNIRNSQLLPIMRDIFTEEVQKSVYDYLRKQCPESDTITEMKAYFYAGGLLQLLLLWMKDPEKFQVDEVNWLKLLAAKLS